MFEMMRTAIQEAGARRQEMRDYDTLEWMGPQIMRDIGVTRDDIRKARLDARKRRGTFFFFL